MTESLHELLARIGSHRSADRRPVVVLDLDSTLIHTGGRHKAILDAFVADHAPHWAPIAASIRPEDIGWSVDGQLEGAGVASSVLTQWQAFWAERFFDGAWCVHDTATPGAVAFVRRLLEEGAIAYYLTARPAPTMGAQTVASLVRLGFPALRGRCPLHMKPSTSLDDARFKRGALREPAALGEVVATFDNEPGHCNTFRAAFPDARHYRVGSVHRPGAPVPHPDVQWLANFTS